MYHAEPDASGVEPEKNREDGLAPVIPREECNELSELPDESFEVLNEIESDAPVETTTSHSQSSPVRHFPDIPTVADDTGDMGQRCSKRQSRPPDKLQYARLGIR